MILMAAVIAQRGCSSDLQAGFATIEYDLIASLWSTATRATPALSHGIP